MKLLILGEPVIRMNTGRGYLGTHRMEPMYIEEADQFARVNQLWEWYVVYTWDVSSVLMSLSSGPLTHRSPGS